VRLRVAVVRRHPARARGRLGQDVAHEPRGALDALLDLVLLVRGQVAVLLQSVEGLDAGRHHRDMGPPAANPREQPLVGAVLQILLLELSRDLLGRYPRGGAHVRPAAQGLRAASGLSSAGSAATAFEAIERALDLRDAG